jgi:hypothetical protein
MRRPFVTTTCALVVSTLPRLLFAQNPPAQNPPAQQPPAQQAPAAPAQPKEPRLPLTGQAGAFLYQIKADQTATFEELLGKVKESLLKSENPVRKQQATGWKVYKASEPAGADKNALYVMLIDPAVPAAEYDLFMLLAEGIGQQQLGTPENQAMFKKYQEVFVPNGTSRLNLSPIASFNGGI